MTALPSPAPARLTHAPPCCPHSSRLCRQSCPWVAAASCGPGRALWLRVHLGWGIAWKGRVSARKSWAPVAQGQCALPVLSTISQTRLAQAGSTSWDQAMMCVPDTQQGTCLASAPGHNRSSHLIRLHRTHSANCSTPARPGEGAPPGWGCRRGSSPGGQWRVPLRLPCRVDGQTDRWGTDRLPC